MHPRPGQSGLARCGDRDDDTMRPAREAGGARGDRMREIRRRIADDAYRTPEVAEEIARRILRSRQL